MINKPLIVAISLTTLLFAVAFGAADNYSLALVCLLLGAIWLFLELHQKSLLASLFFAAFVCLAVVGGLNHAPALLILTGIVTDLAAWDLSRFVARLRPFADRPLVPDLYRKHLIRLSIALGVGYGLAVLPMLIKLSLDFVAFAVLTLLAVIAFRRSILALQQK